jgi:serine/threonine protein kinase
LGLAKQMDQSNAHTVLGTAAFLAPEIRTENPKYNMKIDVWGAGCILVELLTWKRMDYAYELATNPTRVFDLIHSNYATEEDKQTLNVLIGMIKEMLVHDPVNRPDVNILLNKYYMANIPIQQNHIQSAATTPINLFDYDEFNSSSSSSEINKKARLSRLMIRALNLDCYIIIFSFLEGTEVVKCGRVCCWWNEIVSTSDLLYKLLWKSNFNTDIELGGWMQEINSNFRTIRDSFLYRCKLEQNWKLGKYNYTGLQLHPPRTSIGVCHMYTGEKITKQYIKKIYDQKLQSNRVQKQPITNKKNSSKKEEPTLVFNESGIHSMVITGADDGKVRLFDIQSFGSKKPLQQTLLQTYSGHAQPVLCSQFNPDLCSRILFTSGIDKQICFFDIVTGNVLQTIYNALSNEVWDMQLLDSDTICVAGGGKQLQAYSVTSKNSIASIDHDQKVIYALKQDDKNIFNQCLATGSMY